jgi:uncharacterized coiled-coil protein SlyX
MKDAIDRLKLNAELEQLLAEATAPNDDPATMDIDSVLAVSANRICPLMNVKCAALVLIDKQRDRIAELESLCHTQVLYIRAVEAAIHDDMQDSEAGPYCAEHWEGCVTHYPYNPDTVLDVPDYDTIVNKLNVRVAELEAGLQLAQATCAVYSEKVDMLESQLAAQESAHDPQP